MTAERADIAVGHDEVEQRTALLARIGGCWSPTFAPGAGQLALVSDLNGVPQVWTVGAAGGWPQLVTALDDQVGGVAWSPDGEWLAFMLAPGGGMNSQIYLVRPDGRDMHMITPGGRSNNWLGHWTDDGSSLIITSSAREPGSMDACLYDMERREMRIVARNNGIGTLTDVSRDGRRAILYRLNHRSDDNLFLIDMATGAEILLTPHEGAGSFENGQFSPDGATVYLSSNKDREMVAFARVRIDADGKPGEIEVMSARDDAELQEFQVSNDGRHAALVWNVAGRSELSYMDLDSGAQRPGPTLPAEIATGLVFSSDDRQLAMTISGAAAPRNIWVLSVRQGELLKVTSSPHPGIDFAKLVRPELVRFPAHDGLELSGWLYRPQNFAAPGPMVLIFHGGPEAQERPSFRTTYQALLAAGIAVFAPNVRGSAGFGKTFINLDNGPLRVDAVRDIATCLDYVTAGGIADPARIGIMGGSYGGYMTMAGLVEYPERFAAGADLFGIVNFETFFAHSEPWMAAVSKIEYGDPDTEAEMLRSLSPIHRIDRVKAATIVLHGANDTNVPVIEAEQVVEQLRSRDVPVEYVLFPDEGHGFVKVKNRISADVAIVRWFAEHLRVG